MNTPAFAAVFLASTVLLAPACKTGKPDSGVPSQSTPPNSGVRPDVTKETPVPTPVASTSSALGPVPAPAALSDDAKGARAFSAQLYKSVPKSAGENVFFSPASVRIALAMAYAGARGATAAEMSKTLGLGSDPEQVRAAAGYVLRTWSRRAGQIELPPGARQWEREDAERKRETLRVVNRIWGQKGEGFVPAFLNTLADSYEAPLAQLDFARAPEASRGEINAWVERATEQKITDLLPQKSITTDTRLVLTNAVYFKAAWENPFHEFASVYDTFHGPSDVRVKLMHQTETVPYAEVPGAKVLELPYGAGNMSMFIVLPNATDGLPKLEADLSEATLRSWATAPSATRVEISLPRFKTTFAVSLAETLAQMGMPKAFDATGADFSGVDGGKNQLFISAVLHKAFIAVDEKGTEAAAATAVEMAAGAAPMREPDPKKFKADHPFLFFIQDKKLGHILFMGRVVDPAK